MKLWADTGSGSSFMAYSALWSLYWSTFSLSQNRQNFYTSLKGIRNQSKFFPTFLNATNILLSHSYLIKNSYREIKRREKMRYHWYRMLSRSHLGSKKCQTQTTSGISLKWCLYGLWLFLVLILSCFSWSTWEATYLITLTHLLSLMPFRECLEDSSIAPTDLKSHSWPLSVSLSSAALGSTLSNQIIQ